VSDGDEVDRRLGLRIRHSSSRKMTSNAQSGAVLDAHVPARGAGEPDGIAGDRRDVEGLTCPVLALGVDHGDGIGHRIKPNPISGSSIFGAHDTYHLAVVPRNGRGISLRFRYQNVCHH
jgi:hypothetical protein